jgi:hypothetical protein
MNSKYFSYCVAALALGVALLVVPGKVQGQGPLYDRVEVTLPYTVTIGDKALQPGEYVIQQLDSVAGGSRVLLIYGDNGMRFETSAMTIPCLDPNTARDTKVMLHHFGNDYYFDKVWIQGKDYGYEFPLPNSVKQREREEMQPVAVAANYSSTPMATTQQATQPAAPPEMPPAVEVPPTPEPEANRETPPPPAMPKTSADWVMMLLGGGTLSGLGLALRKRS